MVWDGDVSYSLATSIFTKKEIAAMEKTIKKNKAIFKDGVPFPEDDSEYAALLATDTGAKLIQRMIDFND